MTSEESCRQQLEQFQNKEIGNMRFTVDHECPDYPDGLYFHILANMVCPFCAFVWDDITKHPNWKLLKKEQQERILPIWKQELERQKKIYYAPLSIRSKKP
jgi:hypothetical protein